MVRYLLTTLLQIYCRAWWWKNFENRLAFCRVTGKNKVAPFFRTRCRMKENLPGAGVLAWIPLKNQSVKQSINLYRAIVQRHVLQCSYAESKRNVLTRILNVLTDGAVRQFSGREFQSLGAATEKRRAAVSKLCGGSDRSFWVDDSSKRGWLYRLTSIIGILFSSDVRTTGPLVEWIVGAYFRSEQCDCHGGDYITYLFRALLTELKRLKLLCRVWAIIKFVLVVNMIWWR